jgi:hypothetical protein
MNPLTRSWLGGYGLGSTVTGMVTWLWMDHTTTAARNDLIRKHSRAFDQESEKRRDAERVNRQFTNALTGHMKLGETLTTGIFQALLGKEKLPCVTAETFQTHQLLSTYKTQLAKDLDEHFFYPQNFVKLLRGEELSAIDFGATQIKTGISWTSFCQAVNPKSPVRDPVVSVRLDQHPSLTFESKNKKTTTCYSSDDTDY